MDNGLNKTETAESFLEPIQAGHVFFYDTETDEVVHFRREIYEAAQKSSEEMDIDLTPEEEQDAEDAWDILADQEDRYQAVPPVSTQVAAEWKLEFSTSGLADWESFQDTKMNAYLNHWLSSFDED